MKYGKMRLKKIIRFGSTFKNEEYIILRDFLALERTKLANERTLLSYIRASLYLLLGGIALLKIEGFEQIHFLGYISIALTVILLLIGLFRFHRLKQKLRNYYLEMDQQMKKSQEAKEK